MTPEVADIKVDTKALKAAELALVDACYQMPLPTFDPVFKVVNLADIARATVEAYLSAALPILEKRGAEKALDQIIGCYFGWRHDKTEKGEGARIALSAVVMALGFAPEEGMERLAKLEKQFPEHGLDLNADTQDGEI